MSVYFPDLNRSLPNNNFDVMVNAIYPKINAFVSFPPLAITKNEHTTSTVQRRHASVGVPVSNAGRIASNEQLARVDVA
jgi:hypothetical protein